MIFRPLLDIAKHNNLWHSVSDDACIDEYSLSGGWLILFRRTSLTSPELCDSLSCESSFLLFISPAVSSRVLSLFSSDTTNIVVTNDRSEARVDPLAALLVQGQTGKYQAGVSRAT